jgi:nucleoside-diphosphate-sugar epimerase
MKILITGGNGNIAKIIKNHLSNKFDIINPSHAELDLLDFNKLKEFLNENYFDVLIHTAILGGRRTKQETGDITHNNLLMFENIIFFADQFKMILNFDSAAIYDRTTDILNRKEHELLTIPNDYYGFSKYIIHKRSLAYDNFYNFRIFNIFHANEEADRFIKSCFLAKKNNTILTIYEDKYFDFVYEDDLIKIINFYLDNVNNKLEPTINICYKEKYKLSDIAQKIIGNNNINIIKPVSHNNYSGNNLKLEMLNLNLIGLDQALILYENKCVL